MSNGRAMDPQTYQILHVAGAFLLTAFTFQAFAAPTPSRRRSTLIVTGLLSLVVLVAGIGILHKTGIGFPPWVWIKIGAWLGLSALAGLVFRRPGSAWMMTLVAIALVLVSLWAVYEKPLF